MSEQNLSVRDVEYGDMPEGRAGRRGDGGVYLVVADETDEFGVALRYAARMARANRGHLGILSILNIEDVQEWEKVEAMTKALIGYLPIASALVFDLGVYVVVFASALLMLSTMGTVKHRQQAYEEPY